MIANLGTDIEAPADAEIIDAADYIVCAGLIDTHRHLWQTLYKGLVYDLGIHEIFATVYGAYSMRFTAQDIYAGTLLGRLTALDAGITTVLDWAHNVTTLDMEDAGIQALKDAGGRSIFGHGYRGDRTVPSELHRFHDVPRTHEGAKRTRDALPDDDALVSSCFLAIEPPWLISLDACKKELEVARSLGMRTSMHVISFDENFQIVPSIKYMHEAGMLGEDLTFVHLTNATDDEFKIMKDAGVTASLCPQVDSHIFAPPPTGRLLMAGIRPSLSLDTAACGSEDYFSQMRSVFDVERTIARANFQSRPEGYDLTISDVFDFATVQGADAIGQGHRLGSITVGKQADILFVNTKSPNMMPVLDPLASLVFHANVSDIDTGLVAGNPVKRNGMLLADVDKLREQVEESVERLYWKPEEELPEWAYKPHPAARPFCC